MIKNLFSPLFTPSAETLARRELREAERELLRAQSGVEYATQIAAYNLARVQRLRVYVAQRDDEASDARERAQRELMET